MSRPEDWEIMTMNLDRLEDYMFDCSALVHRRNLDTDDVVQRFIERQFFKGVKPVCVI